MVQIVATPDQAKLLAEANESVEIVDANGKRLGYFARPFTNEDISIAKERLASDEPRYTTEQVLEHLRKLESEQ
jgi:hypothetical protein